MLVIYYHVIYIYLYTCTHAFPFSCARRSLTAPLFLWCMYPELVELWSVATKPSLFFFFCKTRVGHPF
uniref:Putative secreted protein n=1 Tax=Xenopsylla cheopis TaxID=163159 RepID=A0A6M2DZL9_XENCH